MLSTTFLGHQGWLFQSKAASFLVDPLLCEEFGHAQALQYRVYPPRVLTFECFPRIDGVVLTHEHDDHFDIPSLARIEQAADPERDGLYGASPPTGRKGAVRRS